MKKLSLLLIFSLYGWTVHAESPFKDFENTKETPLVSAYFDEGSNFLPIGMLPIAVLQAQEEGKNPFPLYGKFNETEELVCIVRLDKFNEEKVKDLPSHLEAYINNNSELTSIPTLVVNRIDRGEMFPLFGYLNENEELIITTDYSGEPLWIHIDESGALIPIL